MAYNNSGKCKTMFGNINNLVLNHNTTNILTENYINARIDESFNQGNMNSKYIDMNDMVSNIGSLDGSFVEEGYQFLMDYNREYYTSLREFYSNIALSEGDTGIINESFSGVWETIKKLIRKFIEFLKRCFKKLSEKLHAIFKSEKYITKHKDLIYKFNSDDDFQFDGYNFTIKPDIPFAKAIPLMTPDTDIVSSFDASARDAATGLYNDDWRNSSDDEYKDLGFKVNDGAGTEGKQTADILDNEDKFTQLCKNYHEKIINGNDAYFDRIRAAVIGEKNGNISQEDFSKELKMKFRDGDESTTTIEADSNYVQQCYINFSNYKDTLKEAEKTKNNLEKEYTHLEKWVDGVAKSTSSTNLPTEPSDTMAGKITAPVTLVTRSAPAGVNLSKNSAFNTLMHDISSNIQRLSNIHTQAYTAKIEAIKDQFAQDKRVLYKAIAQVLKHHKKGE